MRITILGPALGRWDRPCRSSCFVFVLLCDRTVLSSGGTVLWFVGMLLWCVLAVLLFVLIVLVFGSGGVVVALVSCLEFYVCSVVLQEGK